MKLEHEIKLDFNDVLFRPKRSILNSRSEVDVVREFTFKFSRRKWSGVPIISSNMDTISSIEMFKSLSKNRCITCFHKFINLKELIECFQEENGLIEGAEEYFALSTGLTNRDYEKIVSQVEELRKSNIEVRFICIDVANGYMFKLVDFCKKMRDTFPDITLIAGNVVSREITEELVINGGIDIIKVGIGSGAVCTTRLQTGVGMPQFSAVMECADAAHGLGAMIISDGGICHPGDVSKAYGGGADFVMVGSILAGHEECPGNIVEEDGKKYKLFYGMSSDTAMNKHHGGVASYRSSEGKTVKVPFKGEVQNTINNILGGVRSTCTYIGASRLKDIHKCATFIRVNRIVNNFYK